MSDGHIADKPVYHVAPRTVSASRASAGQAAAPLGSLCLLDDQTPQEPLFQIPPAPHLLLLITLETLSLMSGTAGMGEW
jgi:hypothetical protein